MADHFITPLHSFVEKYNDKIDNACEEAHPRKFTERYLLETSGRISHIDPSEDLTKALGEPNWDLLDRKRSRIRPIIFLLAIGGMGYNPEEFVKYSPLIELVHNGTLIHDDIEDGALSRRSDEAIHLRYGLDIAVNSANLMYFSPAVLLKRYRKEFSPKTLLNTYEVLMEHLNRVTWGQALDIYWHNSDKDVTKDEYLQMCCYKTGAIDRLTLSLAGSLTEIEDDLFERIQNYGELLGIAFQIHDDFLDVCTARRELFGGKPIGNDVTEGKKSLVNILTIQNLKDEERERFKDILLEHTYDPRKIQEALGLVEKSKSLEMVRSMGEDYFSRLIKLSKDIFSGECAELLSNFMGSMKDDLEEKYVSRKKI
jgi:geranylgeranyl diphosphate synthase, type I